MKTSDNRTPADPSTTSNKTSQSKKPIANDVVVVIDCRFSALVVAI